MPDHVPKVAELGITSAPLKSAAFFLGPFCKEYTGAFARLARSPAPPPFRPPFAGHPWLASGRTPPEPKG